MKVYRIDVRIYGTAYIKADSEADALKIARAMKDDCLVVDDAGSSDIEISGLPFTHPDLPNVSLSPAMTVHGPDEFEVPELAEDDEEGGA